MKTNKKQDKLENKEIEEESTDEETHLKEFITNEAKPSKEDKGDYNSDEDNSNNNKQSTKKDIRMKTNKKKIGIHFYDTLKKKSKIKKNTIIKKTNLPQIWTDSNVLFEVRKVFNRTTKR